MNGDSKTQGDKRMKILATYEFDDARANIHECDDIEIPVDTRIILNEDTLFSIKRFIMSVIGLRYGRFVVGNPTIKNITIIK